MGKELLNTLENAWARPVLLIAGVDTGGEDAEEVEAEVVQVPMPTWGGMLKDWLFFFWGGGGGHCFFYCCLFSTSCGLVMNTVIRQGTSHEDHKGLCSIL